MVLFMNQHVLKLQKSIAKTYWGEALLTVTYLINKLPTCISNNVSPIESFLFCIPSTLLLSTLPCRVTGCSIFVHSYNLNCSKLDPRDLKYVIISYHPNTKRYTCYHPDSSYLYHQECHLS